MSRFKWRSKKTIINNKQLDCMTFDQLYEELLEKFYIETSDQLD